MYDLTTSNVITDQVWYILDGSGLLIATYELGTDSVDIADLTIYGNNRVGFYDYSNQERRYELTDHLGNVRATIKGEKGAISGDVELIGMQDFYPYGMPMPGRQIADTTRAFGLGGKEKESEIAYTNFELRQYDPRVGRWLSPDPYGQFHSPYLAFANDPARFIDPDGGLAYDALNGPEPLAGGSNSGGGNDLDWWSLYFSSNSELPIFEWWIATDPMGQGANAVSFDFTSGSAGYNRQAYENLLLGGDPVTRRNKEGQVITPNGYGADFADDWYAAVDGNLVMTNGTDYQVWNPETGKYEAGRAPVEVSSTHKLDQIDYETAQIGDVYNQTWAEGSWANYADGMGGNTRTLRYIGGTNWIVEKDWSALQGVELAMWTFPMGEIPAVGGRFFRWLGKFYAGKKVISAVKGLNIGKAKWAQTTFSNTFSEGGKFAGMTVDDVASMLKSGELKVADVPIDVVIRDGNTLILNTRSSAALHRANIHRSKWNVINRTGQDFYENLLNGQLQRNGLNSTGTGTIRQSHSQRVITH